MGIPTILREAASRALADLEFLARRYAVHARERRMPALMILNVSEADLLEIGRTRMRELLDHLAEGQLDVYVELVIERYETGRTSGQQLLGKQGLGLQDFVQALTAQKLALLDWIRTQPLTTPEAVELAEAIVNLYADIEAAYAGSWERVREEYLRLTAENARIRELNAELTRRNGELHLSAEVSRALTVEGGLNAVLGRGLDKLCSLLGVKYGLLWLWDAEAEGLQIRAHYRLDDVDLGPLNRGYRNRHEGGPALEAYNRQAVIALEDVKTDPAFEGYRHYADELAYGAAIYVPLIYLGRGLGLLSLYYGDTHRFAATECQLLRSVADQMAVAVEVSSLVEALRRSRDDLEAQVHARTRELKQERDFISGIVDNAPAAIAYLGPDLTYRWINPEFERLTGLSEAGLIHKGVGEVFPALGPRLTHAGDILVSPAPVRRLGVPYVLVRNGEDVQTYWDTTFVPIRDEGGTLEGLLVMSQEATERVEREKAREAQVVALKEADRLKDQFLSILSHELRTPINAVLGFGSILDDEVAGPLTPDQHHYLQRMLSGADVLLNLVNDLLDMSRIQAGKFSLNPAPMELGPVIEDDVAHLRTLAEQKKQTLSVELAPDLSPLVADSQRIAQVITNLVGNAIKFTPAGGRITVRAFNEGDGVRGEVQDTGPGIAPADVAKLFMPFSQLDMSATRQARGTGLGLSISKALVEAHGGQIGVETEPGRGSTFWFHLPRVARD